MPSQEAIDLSWAMKGGVWWEDIRMAATANQLYSPAGRITFDYTNGGLSFLVNARWNNEWALFTSQMPHSYAEGTTIYVHMHWDQALNAMPNWCAEIRFTNIGGVFGAWTGPLALNANTVAFAANVHQVTGTITVNGAGLGLTLSHMIEIKLYRDSANASGLFAGADPYAAAALVKEMDCHYQVNSPGSWSEFLKWG